jgi:hypothetical protein
MAYDKNKNLILYEKGKSGNPGGLPRTGRLTKKSWERLITKFIKMDLRDFREYFDPEGAHHPTVAEALAGSLIMKAIVKGDVAASESILNRAIGKVTEHIEQTIANNAPQITVTLPANGSEAPESTLKEIHDTSDKKKIE